MALRTIAIEEHFSNPRVSEANREGEWAEALRSLGSRALRHGDQVLTRLAEVGAGRVADMDSAGIDIQVLSHTNPAVENLAPEVAIPLAREANDYLAEAIAAHPDRFAGFATLPATDPVAAAAELERAVNELGFKGALINGRVQDRFLDAPQFWPLLERAEALQVPLYLHPSLPPAAVRQAYYSDLPPLVGHWLSIAAWGWHVETGLHALRLIGSGTFDRFPRLQVVIGHMGEAIPFMLDRTDMTLSRRATGLDLGVKEYFRRNFHVSTSGFFSTGPFRCLVDAIGPDRVLFAVDYPYSGNHEGRAFLDRLPPEVADPAAIAHGNAERLLRISPAG